MFCGVLFISVMSAVKDGATHNLLGFLFQNAIFDINSIVSMVFTKEAQRLRPPTNSRSRALRCP